ncbi:mitochondrial carrier domain-containing protein [Glomus cerebriforme]|uniref:Mitochondrial carrier domain-containing protein n=1 Tax=Glomus cerebriforme TaxID=658196 RepID=A0A397SEC8_9GLOM|nr:mitochondrial carrier domain-containing protein [Glomus cerebriforme]
MVAASKEITTLPPLSPFGNAVAGSLGALFALMIVYPLDIIKTRLQVQSKSSSKNLKVDEYYESTTDAIIKIIKTEGISGLYAGLPAGLIGVASTNFAYFYWYSFLRTRYQSINKQQTMSTISELLLGASAGALAQIFTIPVSVVTTRQQTTSRKYRKNLINTSKEIISDDGITGLWKGLKPSLILCINPAITYGAFERFKDLISKRLSANGGQLSPGIIFWLGALSKTLATIITYPYIMAKVRLQWKPPKDDDEFIDDVDDNIRKHQKYSGAIDVLRKVLESDGIPGWYKGMQAQITKAVLSQALLLYVKEYTTKYTILLFIFFGKLLTNRKKVLTK